MIPKAHKKINKSLCENAIKIKDGFALVTPATNPDMVADEYGLIHGGFISGLADYAAMLAVNKPNRVLASAEVRFFKPIKLGDVLIARAEQQNFEMRKTKVDVKI